MSFPNVTSGDAGAEDARTGNPERIASVSMALAVEVRRLLLIEERRIVMLDPELRVVP